MQSDFLIIEPSWIIPVRPQRQILQDHVVVIQGGKIHDICATQTARDKYTDTNDNSGNWIERHGHALLPGLINAHTHAAMSLFRGLADDLPLNTWLEEHIWPAESKHVNQDFIRDGVELAIAEMLLGGTTCFNDMYFFPDITASVAQQAGIRATVGLIVIDFPTVWAQNADEYIHKGIEVHDETRSLSLIECAWAPHSPYTVSDAPLEKVQLFADELHLPIHMHVHETEQEVSDSITQYGVTPLQRLHQLGLLTPRLLAVHMTQLSDDDFKLAQQQGIHIVHCPKSNLKLASGVCPAHRLSQHGVNVALGSDSAASNNRLDMLNEMQFCSLIGKMQTGDAAAMDAWQSLEYATINAATALNQADNIGSLEVGKAADMITIDLNSINTQPVYDPLNQIMYSASREQVADVWIEGKQRVNQGQLISLDAEHIYEKAVQWGKSIRTS